VNPFKGSANLIFSWIMIVQLLSSL
jgi:hypothetical protein